MSDNEQLTRVIEQNQREITRLEILNNTIKNALTSPDKVIIFHPHDDAQRYYYPHYTILSIGDRVDTSNVRQAIITDINKADRQCTLGYHNTHIIVSFSELKVRDMNT